MTNQSNRGGYKKPPAHARFAPGRTGNPKGRPKAMRSLSRLLNEMLFEPMRIRMDGRSRTFPALTVMLLAAFAKAAKGDHAARRNLMAVADLAGLVDSIPPPIQGRKYGIVIAPELFRRPWEFEKVAPTRDAPDEQPGSAPGSDSDADKDP